MSKLLPNLPIEDLTTENDYLGIIDKGQIIKTFLESNTEEFSQIKMFSLYGEWGSGKSTLMKYLQKELNGSFNTFFFEAWEFESDFNLSLSLLEYLIKESQDSTEEAFGEIVEVATKLFKGFSKSMRITFPGLSIDGSKIIETLEDEPEETFLQLKNKFKTEFVRWEYNKTKKKKYEYNIVFIDDLDRCEPENVLNLLSALKLFFTYGEKTIFFCGIDKKAVNEAVKTKYGKVVKANEYLEKIFDISFTMPEHDDILKLVSQYFGDLRVQSSESFLNQNISIFFNELDFTNPRRVKKVLNKFLIFNNVKNNLPINHHYKSSIPNYIYKEEKGNFFETILVLYFIIALEFNPKALRSIFDLKEKHLNYYKLFKENLTGHGHDIHQGKLEDSINNDFVNMSLRGFNDSDDLRKIIFTFLPLEAKVTNFEFFKKTNFSKIRFKESTIEYKFVKYLINNKWMFLSSQEFSEDCSLVKLRNLIGKIT